VLAPAGVGLMVPEEPIGLVGDAAEVGGIVITPQELRAGQGQAGADGGRGHHPMLAGLVPERNWQT